MALSPCFLRLFPYLDNLVLRRVEKELTRPSAWLLFAFISTFNNLIKAFGIKTLIVDFTVCLTDVYLRPLGIFLSV